MIRANLQLKTECLKKFTMGNETDITVPYGVTSIGNKVFDSCVDLTSMTLPDTVTSIGDYAFYGCNSLTSVTIYAKAPSIEGSPFNFSLAATVNYAGTESEWNASG